MKDIPRLLILLFLIASISSACTKENYDNENLESEFSNEQVTLILSSNEYEVIVINPVEKPDDFNFNTKGSFQYIIDNDVEATFDFGDGEKDNLATKTINGVSHKVDLSQSLIQSDYDKVIVSPLIKTDGCDYIVQGIIEYWKNDQWIATVDFGDGTCDDTAIKYWEGGSKTFSFKEWCKK